MKTSLPIKYLVFAVLLGLAGCNKAQYTSSSEYDDLYYSSKDRKEVKYQEQAGAGYASVDQRNTYSEDRSQRNANPEYTQQYADQNNQDDATFVSDEQQNDSYYDEEYANSKGYLSARSVKRNVSSQIGYNAGFNDGYSAGYNNSFANNFNDPFSSPFRPAYYGGGFRSGISITIGTGFGWGWGGGYRPYRYDPFAYGYDPFYSPYAYGYGGYDPFYSPYGYGYNSWGWGSPYRYGGYYGGYYGGNTVIVVNSADRYRNQYVTRGPRSERSSGRVNSGYNNTPRGGNQGGRTGYDNNSSSGRTSTSATGSEYVPRRGSSSDGRYAAPSRSGYDNAGGRVGNSTNTNTSGSAVRPRSSNTNTYYTPAPSRSSSSSDNTYSRPRGGRTYSSDNNSGGAPSRSSSSNSGGSYSAPSRSSSGSGNSGGSYSAPSPSRSSGGGSSGGGSNSGGGRSRGPR